MIVDPHEVGERVDAYVKSQNDENLFAQLNEAIADIDVAPRGVATHPVVFIVGVPRSGTTFLHQILARNLQVGYINNLIARFWKNPLVGIRLSADLLNNHGRDDIEYVSKHGVTSGACGPHEFGYFWRSQLPIDHSPSHRLGFDALDKHGGESLQKMLSAMGRSFGAPLLFKNLICGLQAKWLHSIYPKSLFVRIHRDRDAVHKSILRTRLERYENPNNWWSLKPSAFSTDWLDLPADTQITRQIEFLNADLDEELAIDKSCVLDVSYEELCVDTAGIITRVRQSIDGLNRLNAD